MVKQIGAKVIKKKMKLKELGLKELSENQMRSINGGIEIKIFGLIIYDTEKKQWFPQFRNR